MRAAMALAAAGSAAAPLPATFPPAGSQHGPLKLTVPRRLPKLDPALFDNQMSFDFTHATVTQQPKGLSLTFPPTPTATTQGWVLSGFVYGIVYPAGAAGGSTAHMVFSATNLPATADFRSNAFELATRRAVTLDWSGYFEPVDFPIQVQLGFGQGQAIGAVTFAKGQVLVGPAGQEQPIGPYVVGAPGRGVRHRILVRADLIARSYTVRFEQDGHQVTSPAIPFPAATAPVPAGMQQVTARLTSLQPYVSGAYDLSRLALDGELK